MSDDESAAGMDIPAAAPDRDMEIPSSSTNRGGGPPSKLRRLGDDDEVLMEAIEYKTQHPRVNQDFVMRLLKRRIFKELS
jgi:hypothetical protein